MNSTDMNFANEQLNKPKQRRRRRSTAELIKAGVKPRSTLTVGKRRPGRPAKSLASPGYVSALREEIEKLSQRLVVAQKLLTLYTS